MLREIYRWIFRRQCTNRLIKQPQFTPPDAMQVASCLKELIGYREATELGLHVRA